MVDRIKRRSFLTSLAALGVVPSLGACAEVVPKRTYGARAIRPLEQSDQEQEQ
ncbi:hypothetical protein ES703_78607 [subsurface metagenome]